METAMFIPPPAGDRVTAICCSPMYHPGVACDSQNMYPGCLHLGPHSQREKRGWEGSRVRWEVAGVAWDHFWSLASERRGEERMWQFISSKSPHLFCETQSSCHSSHHGRLSRCLFYLFLFMLISCSWLFHLLFKSTDSFEANFKAFFGRG